MKHILAFLERRRWFLAGAIVILAACSGGNDPTPTPQLESAPTISLQTPGVRPTLPPTWTPVPTRTSQPTPPPSQTPTETPTPRPSQTLSARAVCEQFAVTGTPQEGVSVAYNGRIGFSWEAAPPDSLVILTLTWDDQETLVTYPPDMGFNALLELSNLPGWGTYTWKMSLYLEPYGEICQNYTGTLYREPWWQRPIQNPLDPPF